MIRVSVAMLFRLIFQEDPVHRHDAEFEVIGLFPIEIHPIGILDYRSPGNRTRAHPYIPTSR